jgi:hypothetical protein
MVERERPYFARPVEQQPAAILLGLYEARVHFMVLGSTAGGEIAVALDPTRENAARLLAWLLAHDAYIPNDTYPTTPNRGVHPTEDALLEGGRTRLQTNLGKLTVTVWSADDYENELVETIFVRSNEIERMIANHAEDVEHRVFFPVVIVGPDWHF